MLKRIFILLLSANLLTASSDKNNNAEQKNNGRPTAEKVLLGVTVTCIAVGTTIIAAPLFLPASTIVAMQTAAAAVAAKATAAGVAVKTVAAGVTIKSAATATASAAATAAPVITEIKKGISVFSIAKGYFYPSEEQQVQQLLRKRAMQRSFEDEIKETFAKK